MVLYTALPKCPYKAYKHTESPLTAYNISKVSPKRSQTRYMILSVMYFSTCMTHCTRSPKGVLEPTYCHSCFPIATEVANQVCRPYTPVGDSYNKCVKVVTYVSYFYRIHTVTYCHSCFPISLIPWPSHPSVCHLKY